jgi:diamine N-acetyltransferase
MDRVGLRRLRASDLDYLYRWENEPEVWQWGDCGFEEVEGGDDVAVRARGERFSREDLRLFIENQQHDIDVAGQLRLVICLCEAWDGEKADPAAGSTDGADRVADLQIGFLDLYDHDLAARSAGVGILICDPADRGRGYGSEALALAVEYARRTLGLDALWSRIPPDNLASLAIFTRTGFALDGDGVFAINLSD